MALRKLAETRALRMGNRRWEAIVRWKTRKILRKLEARFLPEKIYLKDEDDPNLLKTDVEVLEFYNSLTNDLPNVSKGFALAILM